MRRFLMFVVIASCSGLSNRAACATNSDWTTTVFPDRSHDFGTVAGLAGPPFVPRDQSDGVGNPDRELAAQMRLHGHSKRAPARFLRALRPPSRPPSTRPGSKAIKRRGSPLCSTIPRTPRST